MAARQFNGGGSFYRPFEWWEGFNGVFTVLFSNEADNDFLEDTAEGNSRIESDVNFTPVGPPVALADEMSDGQDCSYGLYIDPASGSRIILRSCNVGAPGTWQDWGLTLPTSQHPELIPNTSPLAYRRSPLVNNQVATGSDSLFYGCGSSAAEACEFRLGGPANGATFTLNFGGSFMTNTRPTGISNGYSSPQMISPAFTNANPDRWAFAATVNGSTKAIVSMRETSAITATTTTYSTVNVESTTADVTYSTPMPYVRSDLKTGVVYFRTLAGQTTRVMESSWSGSSWSTPAAVYDTGLQIAPGNEPVPYVELPYGQAANTGSQCDFDALAVPRPGLRHDHA